MLHASVHGVINCVFGVEVERYTAPNVPTAISFLLSMKTWMVDVLATCFENDFAADFSLPYRVTTWGLLPSSSGAPRVPAAPTFPRWLGPRPDTSAGLCVTPALSTRYIPIN